MTFEEAKALLVSAWRDVLTDSAFGDEEVGWVLDGEEIATGYFGGSKSRAEVLVHGADGANSVFYGDEAKELRRLGRFSTCTSNNESADQ